LPFALLDVVAHALSRARTVVDRDHPCRERALFALSVLPLADHRATKIRKSFSHHCGESRLFQQ
jgi:hypothetical protein